MIYFDNAATTMQKPDCVVKAVAEALCSMGALENRDYILKVAPPENESGIITI